jgi:hypothetical protein
VLLLCISYKPLNATHPTQRSSQAEMPSSTPARPTKSRVSRPPRMHSRLYGFKLVKTPPYPLTRARRPFYLAPSLLPILYTICYIYTPHALEASSPGLKLIKTPPDLLTRASLTLLALEAFTIRPLASQNSAKLYRRTSVTIKTL